MPKGVMWRSDDLLLVLNDGAPRARKLTEDVDLDHRSEEHTSELQSLMRISYAVFCLKKKNNKDNNNYNIDYNYYKTQCQPYKSDQTIQTQLQTTTHTLCINIHTQ